MLRLRMPDEDITFTDLIRGDVTFKAGSVPDFVIVRADGEPLYTLVNPVDDAVMGITHVLRGEDLLSSTPRQIALYRALVDIGVATLVPLFGHLPCVLGEGNKKLSKRDPQSNLFLHRDRGFIREGLLNYLAAAGLVDRRRPRRLHPGGDGRRRSTSHDVNANPARFDQKKAEAINADHIRLLAPEDFRPGWCPTCSATACCRPSPPAEQLDLLAAISALVQTRVNVLSEATPMLGFLLPGRRRAAGRRRRRGRS